MNYEEIENILAKKIAGEVTSSELSILEQWRMESADNQALYDEYATIWNGASNYEPSSFTPNFESALSSHLELISEDNTSVIQLNPVSSVSPKDKKTITSYISLKSISSIAAIFVLGVAALFLLNNSSTNITASNGVQFASLEDGSNIWLEEGSSVSYKKGFGIDHRNITLSGKAFFDVNRNEDLPFRIEENDINVIVLGTSFTVDGSNDIVSVNTGRVSVDSESDNVVLTKNQMVSLKNNKLETSISDNDSAKWRNTTLSFDNSPISQVVADINLYHGDKIELDRTSTLVNCPFTSGGLASESLENIIKILEKSYDLTATTNAEGKIKLSISNCE